MPKRCRQTKARKRTALAAYRIKKTRQLYKLKLIDKQTAHHMIMGPLKRVMKWVADKGYIKKEEPAEGEKNSPQGEPA